MNKNAVKIDFNKELYSRTAIIKAKELFKDAAEIDIKYKNKYFQVIIISDKVSAQSLADEFCNAVLMFARKK